MWNKIRLSTAYSYSRLAIPAIERFRTTGDSTEVARIFDTMEEHADPDLHLVELQIRYNVASGDLTRAVQLVLACARIYESSNPRRPARSVIQKVFFACLAEDRSADCFVLAKTSRSLLQDHRNMAGALCTYYIKRSDVDSVKGWIKEFGLVCCDESVANHLLAFIMDSEGFLSGLRVSSFSFTLILSFLSLSYIPQFRSCMTSYSLRHPSILL